MNWDSYFYEICKTVSKNSKCLSRQIGSVLVRDKSIISTGYNGPPIGVPPCSIRHRYDDNLWNLLNSSHQGLTYIKDKLSKCFISKEPSDQYKRETIILDQCPRRILGFKSGEGIEICVAGHSERNSLINAAKNGICTKGTTMYMTCPIPCTQCLIEIVNSGVEEIVVTSLDFYDKSSKYILETSGLKYRLFNCIIEK
jgi:dCMP deaminase